MAGLSRLRHLDVSYNFIQTLDGCLLDRLADRLRYFNIRENRFHCDADCALQSRLRRVYFRLVKRWVVERRAGRGGGGGGYRFQKDRPPPLTTAPFVPGKCWTPAAVRGSSVVDRKCPGVSHAPHASRTPGRMCNDILR